MDSSGSITATNFIKMQNFVIQIFQNLEIGENNTRAALINFNTIVTELFNFQNFKDFNNIQKIVRAIKYTGGNTYTGDALQLANDNILQINKGMRPGNYIKFKVSLSIQ